jgi:hypothetical protein
MTEREGSHALAGLAAFRGASPLPWARTDVVDNLSCKLALYCWLGAWPVDIAAIAALVEKDSGSSPVKVRGKPAGHILLSTLCDAAYGTALHVWVAQFLGTSVWPCKENHSAKKWSFGTCAFSHRGPIVG